MITQPPPFLNISRASRGPNSKIGPEMQGGSRIDIVGPGQVEAVRQCSTCRERKQLHNVRKTLQTKVHN